MLISIELQFLVERINQNYALQIIANSFLSNPSTSSTFATLLINFLLSRMEEMGCGCCNAVLYVYILIYECIYMHMYIN